jgi:tripartite-type tricarboxylate transporter receptor subunit TctC
MKLVRRRFLHLAAGAAALPAISRIAWAQTYPTRPVHLIVGFGAGGAPDIYARLLGQWLSDRLGRPFIIENRPGASSNIATEDVVKARADGYTLLLASLGNAVNATLYEKLNYNFIRDIAPVGGISRDATVMVVNPSFPPRRFPSSSAMPRPIRARLAWRRPASGLRLIWPANCSSLWRGSTWCTYPIAVRRPH